MCKICNHPNRELVRRVEQDITLGKITLDEGAKVLGVEKQLMWYHMKNCVQKAKPKVQDEELTEILAKLKRIINQLLLMPSEEYVKHLPALLARYKELLELRAKMAGQLPEEVKVEINYTNMLKDWLLQNLCDECKIKLAQYLETIGYEVD